MRYNQVTEENINILLNGEIIMINLLKGRKVYNLLSYNLKIIIYRF